MPPAPDPLLSPFRDDVVAVPRDRYAKDAMHVAAAALRAGASRVFEIGSVSAPGISDIDLLVCFPDDVPWERLPRELLRVSGALPSTFLHPPWIMRERHLPALPALFAFQRLTDVSSGEELRPVQSPLQRLLWNVDACCAVLAALVVRRRAISARSALCLLNGITYNVELAAQDGLVVVHAARFAAAIRALRAGWLTLPSRPRLQQLAVLWQLGHAVLRELLDAYSGLLGARHGIDVPGAGELRVAGSRVVYVFDEACGGGAWWRPDLAPRLQLPERIGAVFQLLAQGGLEPWLRWRARGAQAPRRPAAASLVMAAEPHARANAEYLRDVLSCEGPFLPLAAGVLAHVRRGDGWAARAGRAGSRLGAGARRLVGRGGFGARR